VRAVPAEASLRAALPAVALVPLAFAEAAQLAFAVRASSGVLAQPAAAEPVQPAFAVRASSGVLVPPAVAEPA
jgi:hypothetical protein